MRNQAVYILFIKQIVSLIAIILQLPAAEFFGNQEVRGSFFVYENRLSCFAVKPTVRGVPIAFPFRFGVVILFLP